VSNRVGGAFVLTFAAQLLASLQGLVVLPIVVRWSGAATYGAYVLVNITLSQFMALLTTGIAFGYTRHLVSVSSFSERRRLFEPQFNFQLLAFAIVSVCLLLAGPALDTMFDSENLHVTSWVLVAFVAANILQRQVLDYYRYTLRIFPFNIVGGGTTIVFVISLATFTFLNHALSLDELLAVQIFASVLMSLPFSVGMLREIGLPRISFPLKAFIREFRAGLSLTLDMALVFVLTSGDRYLITAYLSVLDVGRYQPAYQLASAILALPRLVITVLSPTISRLIDAGNRAEAERIVESSLSLFLMVGVPFIAGTVMIGPSLILVLTNADVATSSRWVSPLVAVGAVFCGALWILETVVIGLKRLKLVLIADIEGAVANLGVNFALFPFYKSITVPAIAASLGFAVAAVGLALHLRSSWKLNVEWFAFFRFCVASLAMAGVLWLLGFSPGEVRSVGIAYLAASIVGGVITYFVALSALGGFGRRERTAIRNLLASRAPETGAREGDLAAIQPPAGS
jgi:O-antigen/teichoic acid export membrane protein